MFGWLSRLLRHVAGLILGVSTGQNFPPSLTRGEEKDLFLRLKTNHDTTARAILIEHNLRLVAHIVRKYYASYPAPDELISIGSLGLIKAVDTFKPETGARFATYGARCIQNEILMFFRSQKKQANEVSLSETIDMDRDGNPLTYIDIIQDTEDVSCHIDRKRDLNKLEHLLNTALEPRDRDIIFMRYGLRGKTAMTQREVAEKLGISRSYVSRIEKKALGILRKGFGDQVPDFSDTDFFA